MTVLGRFAPEDFHGSREFLRELKDNAASYLHGLQCDALTALPWGSAKRNELLLAMLGRAKSAWTPGNGLAAVAAALALFDELVLLGPHVDQLWLGTFYTKGGLTSLAPPAPAAATVIDRLLNDFADLLRATRLNAIILPDITILAPGAVDVVPKFVFHAHAICWAAPGAARQCAMEVARLNRGACVLQLLGRRDVQFSVPISLVPSELWGLAYYAAKWPPFARRRAMKAGTPRDDGAKLKLTPLQTRALTAVLAQLPFVRCSRSAGEGEEMRTRWLTSLAAVLG